MLVNDSADYSGEPMKVIPIPVKKKLFTFFVERKRLSGIQIFFM